MALYFIILQFLIICSLALLFSSFSSPLLSAVFAFSLFVIGSFAEDLRGFASDGQRHDAVAGDGGGLPGAEFFGAERDQFRGTRSSRFRRN